VGGVGFWCVGGVYCGGWGGGGGWCFYYGVVSMSSVMFLAVVFWFFFGGVGGFKGVGCLVGFIGGVVEW